MDNINNNKQDNDDNDESDLKQAIKNIEACTKELKYWRESMNNSYMTNMYHISLLMAVVAFGLLVLAIVSY